MAAKNESTFVGLDIGTSKVVFVVGLHQEDMAEPSIIGLGVAPTTGLRRGTVSDVEETVASITTALEEAERMSGVTIERATISVDGAHIQSLNSKGVIAVSRADHEISREDLARVEEAAAAIQMDSNRQILQVIPKSYTVDSQTNVVDPVGMNGVRLEVDTHIITAASPAMKNLTNSVFRAGLQINDQLLVPLAAARAVLSKRQFELGVALVDIGAETTGIAVFEEGGITFTTILPVGSNHITKDLVYGLRTNIDVAEKLKLARATAVKDKARANEKVDLADFGGSGVVSQGEIDKIVTSRSQEIFEMVHAELRKVGKDSMLAGGVVLTGGGAKLKDIDALAQNILKLNVSIATPKGFGGISDKVKDPAYAAAVGLMLEDMNHIPPGHGGLNRAIGGVLNQIKGIFKNFLP